MNLTKEKANNLIAEWKLVAKSYLDKPTNYDDFADGHDCGYMEAMNRCCRELQERVASGV